MPLSVLEAFEAKYHQPIIEGYGLSEASPVVSVNPPERVKKGSIGLPLPGIQVKIADPDGRAVPQGGQGELLVKGDNVMLGYWHRPEATAATIVDGWLHTGDSQGRPRWIPADRGPAKGNDHQHGGKHLSP